MSKIQIFDPAMCCSTGVCGPSVNPQLIRVATVINNLKKQGILVERYTLNNDPQAYVDNINVNDLIKSEGVSVLPITVVDGIVVKTKEYLTNEEFANYLNIKVSSFLNNNNKFNFSNFRRK
jgi:hypothetical protein